MKEIGRREFLKDSTGFYLSAYTLDILKIPENLEHEPPAINCPIYMFHEVNPNTFPRFVNNLLAQSYQPVRIADLVNYFETGIPVCPADKTPFILSFDDGLLSQKQNALPVLLENRVPAVFAVMPNWEGDGVHRYMTNSDFRELADLGMEVVSHTINHANLPALKRINRGAWESEIIESKETLQEIIGQPVNYFCYPLGAYDQETILVVSQYYQVSLAKRGFTIQRNSERYILPRQRMS